MGPVREGGWPELIEWPHCPLVDTPGTAQGLRADPLSRVAVDYICSAKLFSLPHKDKRRRRLSTAAGSGERAAPLCSQNERGRKWGGVGWGVGGGTQMPGYYFSFLYSL